MIPPGCSLLVIPVSMYVHTGMFTTETLGISFHSYWRVYYRNYRYFRTFAPLCSLAELPVSLTFTAVCSLPALPVLPYIHTDVITTGHTSIRRTFTPVCSLLKLPVSLYIYTRMFTTGPSERSHRCSQPELPESSFIYTDSFPTGTVGICVHSHRSGGFTNGATGISVHLHPLVCLILELLVSPYIHNDVVTTGTPGISVYSQRCVYCRHFRYLSTFTPIRSIPVLPVSSCCLRCLRHIILGSSSDSALIPIFKRPYDITAINLTVDSWKDAPCRAYKGYSEGP